MRICYVISSLKIGGAEVALTRILPRIQQKGHDVFVAFFHDGPMRKRLIELGITPVQITGLIAPYDPLGWWHLSRFLHKINPDLIHTSLWLANIMGRCIGASLKVPVISDLHGNCKKEGILRNIGDRLTAHLSATTIAVSQSVAEAYRQLVAKNAPLPIITIPNGITISQPQNPIPRTALGIPAEAFVIGAVGRLEPIKGYDLLLSAIALLPSDTWLVLVGDGSQYDHLVKLADNLGIANRCVFTGFRTDTASFYPLFDCFALSSHSEGLSLALLEAMAQCIPVISTNESLTHDVITHGRTGLLVTTRIPADYAFLLHQIKQSHQLQKTLGQRGKQHVLLYHNLDSSVAQLEQVYREIKIQSGREKHSSK
jgi:glycosyltransferase involved in cell wall biosynthesis